MMRVMFLVLVLVGALAAVVALVAGVGLWQTQQANASAELPVESPAAPVLTAQRPQPSPQTSGASTASAPVPAAKPVVVEPAGTIVLRAANAIVQGFDLRLEGDGENKTAVNWVNRRDGLEWPVVEVPISGIWEVELEYACPPDAAGGMAAIVVGPSQLLVRIQPTNGWNDFQTLRANMYIREGRGTLAVRPSVILGRQSLMTLKTVKLRLTQEAAPFNDFERRRFRRF